MTTFYTQIDQYWDRFPSRGDSVSITRNDATVTGMIYAAQGDSVFIDLNGSGRVKASAQNLNYVDRYVKLNQNIPIEVGDLISILVNGELLGGVISGIISPHKTQVRLGSRPDQQVVVESTKLRFRAKGYLINPPHPEPANPPTPQPNRPPEVTTVDTIIYKAPCVVKVVPYDSDPGQFEDLMEVHLSDDPENVVILPIVRMKCGTILVVDTP